MVVAARILRLHNLVVEILIHRSLALVFLIGRGISHRFLLLHRHFRLAVKAKLLLWFCTTVFVIVGTNILSHQISLLWLIVLVALTDIIDRSRSHHQSCLTCRRRQAGHFPLGTYSRIWASNCIDFGMLDHIKEPTDPNHDHKISEAQPGHRSLVEQFLLPQTFLVLPEGLPFATRIQLTSFADDSMDSYNYFSTAEPKAVVCLCHSLGFHHSYNRTAAPPSSINRAS